MSRTWISKKAMLARAATVAGIATAFGALPAMAHTVVAQVHLSQQRMEVFVDGVRKYSWRVSTGKEGWQTHPGSYTPYSMKPYYFSKKWNMSLPYLIWIGNDGTAIHGTSMTDHLGRPASHGCIRLDTGNASILYHLVEGSGMDNTSVVVTR